MPYRGGGPLATAAAAGEVDLAIASRVGLGGQVGTQLRALAQSGAKRSPALPDLPTFAESGFPGVAAEAFWGMLGPAGVPGAGAGALPCGAGRRRWPSRLARQRLEEGQGVDIVASSPEAVRRFPRTPDRGMGQGGAGARHQGGLGAG